MKVFNLVIVFITGFCLPSFAAVDKLICAELESTGNFTPVVEVSSKVKSYGYLFQVLKLNKSYSVGRYGQLHAGSIYDNTSFQFHGIDTKDCTDGFSLNVIQENKMFSLIFTCSIDSIGADSVVISSLFCEQKKMNSL